jgi:hypothetical protein
MRALLACFSGAAPKMKDKTAYISGAALKRKDKQYFLVLQAS